MKVGIIIQARMGSTRLPGKVLKKIGDKSVLGHIIERVKETKNVDELIVATTELIKDNSIAKEAKKYNASIYRGSENNVLNRFYGASKKYNLDVVTRITADCPFVDPNVIDEMINLFLTNKYDIVTNDSYRDNKTTFPRGFDVEIFKSKALKVANSCVTNSFENEHVTPHIFKNTNSVFVYKYHNDHSHFRLTLDTQEDLELIQLVFNNLYSSKPLFLYEDIIEFLIRNPDIASINADVQQKIF